MNRNIDALLAAGNLAQREKLQQNGHKEGFSTFKSHDINFLYHRLVSETVELKNEVDVLKYDYNKIRNEAADVANFAHMIILACDKELS